MRASTERFSGWFGTTYVSFRTGGFPSVADLLDDERFPRPLGVVATPSQERLGRVETLVDRLGDACGGVYARARDHTSVEAVGEASAALAGCASVIAVGGGGAIGLAKARAVATGAPYAVYPTTFSGSEMTDIWGIVRDGEKTVRRDACARASTVAYDPLLFATLPPQVLRASLFNCIAHCLELAWLEGVPPVALLAADEACRLIGAGVDADGAPREPRSLDDLVTASWLAGTALSVAGVGVEHTICHLLGGATGVSHALLHAIVLPAAMRLNRGAGTDAQRRLVAHLCGRTSLPPDEAVEDLRRRWGLPAAVRELRPAAVDAGEVSRRVLSSASASRNVVPIEEAALRACIERVIDGE